MSYKFSGKHKTPITPMKWVKNCMVFPSGLKRIFNTTYFGIFIYMICTIVQHVLFTILTTFGIFFLYLYNNCRKPKISIMSPLCYPLFGLSFMNFDSLICKIKWHHPIINGEDKMKISKAILVFLKILECFHVSIRLKRAIFYKNLEIIHKKKIKIS